MAEQYRVFGAPGAVLVDAAGESRPSVSGRQAAVGDLLAAIVRLQGPSVRRCPMRTRTPTRRSSRDDSLV